MTAGKLPVVSGKQLVNFFKANGFELQSRKGSHISLKKKGISRRVVVPDHKEVSFDIILSNLKTAKISKKDFIAGLKK